MADTAVRLHGIDFANPVLPAAGPNVRTGAMMVAAARAGAGGIVSKTVGVRPARDARPTIRRTGNGGLMNAETWSEIPVEEYLDDLRVAKATGLPLVVSVGYRPDEVAALGRLIEREVAPDVFEFSTHYTGGRTDPIVDVARSLREAVRVPVWMKISPNFPDIPGLAAAVSAYVDGFVAINSYGPVLDFDPEDPRPLLGSPGGTGWLSGAPIRPIALRIVADLARSQTKPVIGVGGVASGRDAVQFLMAGASLVQVCSAAIEHGHSVYGRIAREIADWLDAHGYASVAEVTGRYPRGEALEHRVDPAAAIMTVDPDACTGCSACIRRCIHEALSMEGGIAVVAGERCIGCGYCADSCRFAAMELKGVGA